MDIHLLQPAHDTGTEELAYVEIVATIVKQLTQNMTPEEIEIKASGFDT